MNPPKPPPLPKSKAKDASAEPPRIGEPVTSPAPAEPPEVEFLEAGSPETGSPDIEFLEAGPPEAGPPEAGPPQAGPSEQDALTRAVSREAARTYYQDEARLILSAERGLTPRAQAMLVGTAERYGLSAREAEDALTALMPPAKDRGPAEPPVPGPPPAVAAPVPPPPTERRSDPPVPPVAGATAEPPLAPPQPPAETFRLYVVEALRTLSRPSLSDRKERKLIQQGVDKLRLSRALARQVLHRVADEQGIEVLSRSAAAPVETEEAAVDEPHRWEEFRGRAAAILAEQRGINARSRMLLEAAAEELGVPASQIDLAVASLRPADHEPVQRQLDVQERVADYREYLEQVMAQLQQGPVTARMQQKWLTDARERFGIGAEQASQTIRRVAADRGIRVIREQQAEEHLLALMRRSLRDEHLPRQDLQRRLRREGEHWGLTAEQVDGLIQQETRRQQRRARIRGATLFLLVAVPLVGGLAYLTILAANRNQATGPTEARRNPDVLSPTGPPSIHAPTGREWWSQDTDLLSAVTRLRTAVPELAKPLAGLNLEDPDARADSYAGLVATAAGRIHDETVRGALTELMSGCLTAEPSDESAEALSELLLGLVPRADDPLPRDTNFLEVSFWAVESLAAALARDAMPDYRREFIAGQVEGTLDVSLDLNRPETLRWDLPAALVRSQLRMVIEQADEQPLLALPLFQAILQRGQRHLDRAAIQRARLDLLTAALPTAGDSWREYEPLLLQTVHSDDPLIVLELVDVMDRIQDPDLQEELAAQLLVRVGQHPLGVTPAEAASRVRDALGASLPVSGEQRWRRLREMAEPLLAPIGDAATTDSLLQQTVDAGRIATLAAALASGEAGTAAFDALLEQGDFRLVAPTLEEEDEDEAGPVELTARQERYERQAREFARYFSNSRSRSTQRIVMLRNLSALASHFPELPMQSAIQLAAYLLSAKSDEEHQQLLELVPAVARWKNVRLALADAVLETGLQQERAQRIVYQAMRNANLLQEVTGDWKRDAYEALLRDVLDQLPNPAPDSGPSLTLYDDACEYLRDFYQVQAHLSGVPVEAYAGASSPSQLLRLMIETTAAQRNATAGNDPAQAWLRTLPHRLIACEHAAAENDLLRTLVLQRTWIRMVAFDLSRRMPQKAAAIDEYVAALQPLDRNADSVIQQLAEGERTLLQMWLLAAPPL
jgi:hypothetical protein